MRPTSRLSSATPVRMSLALLSTLLVLLSLTPFNLIPTVAAQSSGQPGLSADEKREASQLSRAFTKRLSESQDLALVMNELFLPDSVERYLRTESKRASAGKDSKIFLAPGLFINARLLDNAQPEDWRRFYIAANNFMLLGLVNVLHHQGDFEDFTPTDMYSREVIELLDTNPLLSNFILKKGPMREFKSVEEMRSAAATLEQAVALMRKASSGQARDDLDKAVVQMAMRKAAPLRTMKEEDLEKARAEMIQPQLEVGDDEILGFPKGTRLISVYAFPIYELVMVKENGKLRIAWAYLNAGD
jgi:hypothetical protein